METDSLLSSPSQSTPQTDSLNLRHYWHIVLERRWLVITAFISVFALSLIYLFKATPIYEATARLQIDREADSVLRIEGLTVGGQQDQDYLQTQYKNLLSRTLISSVVTKLKLDQDERYSKYPDVVDAVSDDITVAPVRLSRLVDVRVRHSDRKKAALIANTLVKAFEEGNLNQKTAASYKVELKLKQEADSQRIKLEAAEKNLRDYAEKHKMVSLDEREDIVLQALRQMQGDAAKARSEAEAVRKTVEEIDRMLTAGTPIETLPQVANDQNIQNLRKELAVMEANFAEIQKRYKSKYPLYIFLQQKIASLNDSISNQALTIIAAIRNQATSFKAVEERLTGVVKEQEAKQLEVGKLRIQYALLKREAEMNDSLYRLVLSRLKEMELTGRNKINNIRVVDDAIDPIRPIKPRPAITIFLGVIGGLAAAIGLAFFVNYLDDSVKSQEDVESFLRLPFLGYIPNIKSNSVVERDLQAHLHPQSNAAEGFRTLRATISLTHSPDKFRAIAVTSTIPSEGKSLVASNLAIVMAQTGLKTLLVDADLRRPSVHKAFKLHSPQGLSSYLTEEVENLEKIAHPTEVPNLDVVCCGSVPSTPSELIGSKRMIDFLNTVRNKYDRVILDCPPISAVSDPLVIAAKADGIVFVTKFNKIRREHARKSAQRIQNAGIHIMGVVLNDIDFEGKDSYYYSYYYYQNRYYASHYKTKPSANGTPGKGGKQAELASKQHTSN